MPNTDRLLLEDGSFLLLEDGFYLLLESSVPSSDFEQGPVALCRTYRVAADPRVLAVPFESRVYRVPQDPRTSTQDC